MAPGCFTISNQKQQQQQQETDFDQLKYTELTTTSTTTDLTTENIENSLESCTVNYQIPLPSDQEPTHSSYSLSDDEDDEESDSDSEDSDNESTTSSSSSNSESDENEEEEEDTENKIDSFEILEQTIMKQKRLARLKNTDLRKKILLKRTFDLVCEIMDKENGFDDLDHESPQITVTINQKNAEPPASYAPLTIVQLEQSESGGGGGKVEEEEQSNLVNSNDIIYINLFDCSFAETVNTTSSSSSSNATKIKKRRLSNDDEDEEEEEEDELEDDFYSSNSQNILVLNKNNEYDLNEKVLSEFSASFVESTKKRHFEEAGGDLFSNSGDLSSQNKRFKFNS